MRPKYNARKTTVDGIKFDSKAEADRYEDLKTLEAAGVIHGLTLQPKYTLQEGYIAGDGRKIRAITYIADFMYTIDGSSIPVIEDVKGIETEAFKIKRKLFEAVYNPLTVTLVRQPRRPRRR